MVNFAIYDFMFGKLKIGYEDDCLTYLKLVKGDIVDMGHKSDFSNYVYKQLNEYLEGSRKLFDVKYKIEGTEFQKKVYKALCDIPYGETRSYKEIAIAIGNEKAVRAVGMANNRNPITIIVPCHRVIGSNGKLVGYAGGLDMKEYLLDLEKRNK